MARGSSIRLAQHVELHDRVQELIDRNVIVGCDLEMRDGNMLTLTLKLVTTSSDYVVSGGQRLRPGDSLQVGYPDTRPFIAKLHPTPTSTRWADVAEWFEVE